VRCVVGKRKATHHRFDLSAAVKTTTHTGVGKEPVLTHRKRRKARETGIGQSQVTRENSIATQKVSIAISFQTSQLVSCQQLMSWYDPSLSPLGVFILRRSADSVLPRASCKAGEASEKEGGCFF
jgi:hypothetical protein